MKSVEVEKLVMELDNVQKEENFGYTFFFVGDEHRLPFVTIGHSDNEFDTVSSLNRDGIFRINIGVSKKTFESLLVNSGSEVIDYSVLDVFLPHPHYAKQNFICILNPTGENANITKQLIVEAHSIAASRLQRKLKRL
ncbi:MAG: hypothetical protein KC615_22620 [Anaerolineae bacterium]|nr:hypothetical protein [Anaerolineae bacterium]MCA9895803.1 hypothetical protein [Anaerolineae bacterium]